MNLESKVEYLMQEVESLKRQMKELKKLPDFAIKASLLSKDEFNEIFLILQLLGAVIKDGYHSEHYTNSRMTYISKSIYLCVINGVLDMTTYEPSGLPIYTPDKYITPKINEFISVLTSSVRAENINSCENIVLKTCKFYNIECDDWRKIIDMFDRFMQPCPCCNKIYDLDELTYSNYDYDYVCEHCNDDNEPD